MMTATYSFEDNKLRLYSIERLDPDTYKRIKALGFIWAPKQQLFVAPMWTPSREAVLIELAGSIENEDITLEERAAERASRFETYSEKRAADSERYANNADNLSQAFAGGQPILVGHHSEKGARRLAAKIENSMRASIKYYEQSEYWTSRSSGVLRAASRRERPDVRIRRIKKLESEKRKYSKEILRSNDFIQLWQSVKPEKALNLAGYDRISMKMEGFAPLYDGHNGFFSIYEILNRGTPLTEILPRILACHERTITNEQVWIEHLNRRINYEKEMLKASGHEMPDFKAISAAKRSKSCAVPIVNDPSIGTPITKEQWSKCNKDYKSVRRSKCGKYRYRSAIERCIGIGESWSLTTVYIKDQKVIEVPKEVEATA